ncbi:hypothetical protein U9M48_001981, partial [Paspalum notatum var. saurae]
MEFFLCQPKDKLGMGIQDLDNKNTMLLRLITDEICLFHLSNWDSNFCASLMKSGHMLGFRKTNGWKIQPYDNNIRRDLTGHKLTVWNNLFPRIANIVLSQEQDEFRWKIPSTGQFSVKSHCQAMIHSDVSTLNKRETKSTFELRYSY